MAHLKCDADIAQLTMSNQLQRKFESVRGAFSSKARAVAREIAEVNIVASFSLSTSATGNRPLREAYSAVLVQSVVGSRPGSNPSV